MCIRDRSKTNAAQCVNCNFVLKTLTEGDIGDEYADCPECGEQLFYTLDITDRKKIMVLWKAQSGLIKDSYKLLEEINDPVEKELVKKDIKKLRKLMKNTQKAYMKELKRV